MSLESERVKTDSFDVDDGAGGSGYGPPITDRLIKGEHLIKSSEGVD